MKRLLPPATIAFALSIGGCAEMDWTKPGADNAAVSRDLEECRGPALRGAVPAAAVGTPPSPADRGGTPTRPAGTSNERFIAEHESVRQCMAGRG